MLMPMAQTWFTSTGAVLPKSASRGSKGVLPIIAAGCAILFLSQGVVGQDYMKQATIVTTEASLEISANSPRPLAQVIDALQQAYGWEINYEDAQYRSVPDYKEVPAPQYFATKAGTKIRVPSGGNFSVTVPVRSISDASPDEQTTLQAIVDAYNQSENPGRFELRKDLKGNFDLVGISARDGRSTVAIHPLLDTEITIPKKQRTLLEVVDLVCSTLSLKSHSEVSLGVYPRTILLATPTTGGASKVPARQLLAEVLSSASRGIRWQLLYDPEGQDYFLNLSTVANKPPVRKATAQTTTAEGGGTTTIVQSSPSIKK